MKVFACYRSKDEDLAKKVKDKLLAESDNFIAILQETEHSTTWKKNVEQKMQESDFVLFLLGSDTFESEQIIWEYAKAKDLNKQIIGIRLENASEESIIFCQGFQVFNDLKKCFQFLSKTYEDNRKLKLEQYKIMVSSTEKVTENRMKVNNLFFTITSSILSVSFILGKSYQFSLEAMVALLILTIISLVISHFWERLINSYALLNQGKFLIIDKIEKQLRTNMFEAEWKVLTEEISYLPNSKTEMTIVKYFRTFIYIIGGIELIYIGYLIYQNYSGYLC